MVNIHAYSTDNKTGHYFITHFDWFDDIEALYQYTELIDVIPRRSESPRGWEGTLNLAIRPTY